MLPTSLSSKALCDAAIAASRAADILLDVPNTYEAWRYLNELRTFLFDAAEAVAAIEDEDATQRRIDAASEVLFPALQVGRVVRVIYRHYPGDSRVPGEVLGTVTGRTGNVSVVLAVSETERCAIALSNIASVVAR